MLIHSAILLFLGAISLRPHLDGHKPAGDYTACIPYALNCSFSNVVDKYSYGFVDRHGHEGFQFYKRMLLGQNMQRKGIPQGYAAYQA